MKKSEKLKLSLNYFPVKIFGKGFNSSFSIKFYIFKKKKKSVYMEFTQKAIFSLSFFLPLSRWRLLPFCELQARNNKCPAATVAYMTYIN